MKRTLLALVLAVCLMFGCAVLGFAAENDYPALKADGSIDVIGYFQVNGVKASLSKDSVDFTLTGSSGTATFIKDLAADDFVLRWNGADGNKSLNKAVFELSDADDPAIAIHLSMGKVNDAYTGVQLNSEKRSYLANGSTYLDNQSDFTVYYDKTAQTIGDSAGYAIPILTTVNGERFTGFPSGKVRLTVRLEGAAGGKVRIKSINQQRLGSNYTTDKVEPYVCLSKTMTQAVYGSTIELPTAFAVDVYSNKASVTMKVLTPDGDIATATDGTALDSVDPATVYQLKMAQYGTYRIVYTATDGINSSSGVAFSLTVPDRTGPTVTLDGKVSGWKVGEPVVLPVIQANDNCSASEAVSTWITVKHPDGYLSWVSDTYTPDTAGAYEITFNAVDEGGNITSQTVAVLAK